MSTPTLKEQIAWLQGQAIFMEQHMPIALAEGKLSPEMAGVKLACAKAALASLRTLLPRDAHKTAEEHQQ